MTFRGSSAAVFLTTFLLALLTVTSTSCVVRRRLITRKGGQATQTLLNTDKETLLREIARQYAAVNSLNATVDMVPALGTANKGKITEYKDVRAYIIFRKPADIRIIGLYPVVRNKAFDMVSDGSRFRVYIPSKNRFLEGLNTTQQLSENKLENLRPQHFLEAMFVRPIDLANEQVLFENFTDEDNANYIVSEFSAGAGGQPLLQRTIWFDRLNLRMARQLIFDPSGNILTDARYNDWQRYDNVLFPKHIEINRPQDEYGVVITMVKVDINKAVTDDKFTLEQPPGTELRVVGAPVPPKPASPPPAATKKGSSRK